MKDSVINPLPILETLATDLSTTLAQCGTVIIGVGVCIAQGITAVQQAEEALALQSALKADALNDLQQGMNLLQTTNTNLNNAKAMMESAQTACTSALAAINAAVSAQQGSGSGSGGS
jgi:3-oxoacyl-(acyl-carrier-protein) synthase